MSVKCFWKRLVFELINWVKQIALPSVGGIQSIEGLNRKKGRGRQDSLSLYLTDWAGTLIFSWPQCSWCLDLQTGIYIIIGSPAPRFSNYSTSFPGSSAYRLQMVGLLSLHNHMSQFLIIKPLIYMNEWVSEWMNRWINNK